MALLKQEVPQGRKPWSASTLPHILCVTCPNPALPLNFLLTHCVRWVTHWSLLHHQSYDSPSPTQAFEIPLFHEVPHDLLVVVSEPFILIWDFMAPPSRFYVAGVHHLLCSCAFPELWPQAKDDKNCIELEGRSGLWWSSGPGNQGCECKHGSPGASQPYSLRSNSSLCWPA